VDCSTRRVVPGMAAVRPLPPAIALLPPSLSPQENQLPRLADRALDGRELFRDAAVPPPDALDDDACWQVGSTAGLQVGRIQRSAVQAPATPIAAAPSSTRPTLLVRRRLRTWTPGPRSAIALRAAALRAALRPAFESGGSGAAGSARAGSGVLDSGVSGGFTAPEDSSTDRRPKKPRWRWIAPPSVGLP
jgi:hypothetical protein